MKKVSAVDTAWLRMDRPTNLMMICGVLMLDRRLSLARLRRIVGERFLVFRRFRQRTVRTAAGAWWRDAADFDLRAHVVAVKLPGDAGDRELQALVSTLAQRLGALPGLRLARGAVQGDAATLAGDVVG